MIDDFAKDYLHRQLEVTREALVWKLDGLSEYDIRRPLTVTGTLGGGCRSCHDTVDQRCRWFRAGNYREAMDADRDHGHEWATGHRAEFTVPRPAILLSNKGTTEQPKIP